MVGASRFGSSSYPYTPGTYRSLLLASTYAVSVIASAIERQAGQGPGYRWAPVLLFADYTLCPKTRSIVPNVFRRLSDAL
jgi:hypothetical protein